MVADTISLILFAFVIFTTQCGILNRPGCYEICNGRECGIFPASTTWKIVQEGLRSGGKYPAILFGFLAMQLVICAVFLGIFRDAVGVYLQDDEPFEEVEADAEQGDVNVPEEERGQEGEYLLRASTVQTIDMGKNIPTVMIEATRT